MTAEEKTALRAKVRALLPQSALALMDEVEAFAGQQISIEPNPSPVSPTDISPNAPELLITQANAAIRLRDLDAIDPQGIVHELLHAKRYWVDAVAQLRPSAENNSEENRAITAQIENIVEHLAIVPMEAEYGFDPYGHWNEEYRISWSDYPWTDLASASARRRRCLMGWLGAALVNDQEVLQLIQNCLAQEGLLVESRKLLERVQPFMARSQDKPRALASVARFLPIPTHALRIVYFDITNGTRKYEPMPHR